MPPTTAIKDAHIDIFEDLLAQGVGPNTGEGLPAMNAVKSDDEQRLRLLVDAGQM